MPSGVCDELICLLGPTASGKSAVAVEIAQKLPVEIVSVDSALIYKGMDIGTAKPEAQIRARIPHHLIDIIEPDTYYSAARFREEALATIAQIRERRHIPLLVGGTMFYFHALQHGLSPIPESSPDMRAELIAQYKSTENLYKKLQSVDPLSASRIHPHDKQRVLRALAVSLDGEQIMSSYQTPSSRTALAGKMHYIALDFDDRTRLHQRIEQRLNEMLQRGLLDEVAKLMLRGDLDADSAAMRTIAYRQAWQHLIGHYSYSEMVQSILAASRQFAKRQLTWMRKMPIATRYAVDTITPQQLAERIVCRITSLCAP